MFRFTILMYHSIGSYADQKYRRYSCAPDRFRRHLNYLRSINKNLISLDDIRDSFEKARPIPPDSVAVTFDDGFLDNYTNALPILEEYQIPATVFVTTGLVGDEMNGGNRKTHMGKPILAWHELQQMQRRGITLGAHSMTHPRLPDLPQPRALEEIVLSKAKMEDELGGEIAYFAYPYGLYDQETKTYTMEAGYRLACSTRSGFNNLKTDPYALRRIEVYGTDPVWKLAQKLRFGITEATLFFPLSYYFDRFKTHLSHRL